MSVRQHTILCAVFLFVCRFGVELKRKRQRERLSLPF